MADGEHTVHATPPPGERTEPPAGASNGTQWLAFSLVCLAYLAVTVGEQAFSPVLPEAAPELALDEQDSGIIFGVLAGSIAVANLVGGAFLGRLGVRKLMLVGLVATTAGAVIAAVAPGLAVLVIAHVLLGAGAGLYFPAGLRAVPAVAGARRRGMAMGLYGVAFSGGLTLAALLGTLGAAFDWRWAFWATAALAAAAAVSTIALHLPPADGSPISLRFPSRAVFGLATFIGAIGAICQYGAIPFLTTYAVAEWDLTAGAAAGLLAVGRVVSILAKVASGASTDRIGPIASARRTGVFLAVTGLAWVLLPGGWLVYGCAALFAGVVSSLFPVANLVALDRFGGHGPALGAYRSAQIGIGAAAGWLIGWLGAAVGLRTTLAIAVGTPILLALLLRPAGPSAPSDAE